MNEKGRNMGSARAAAVANENRQIEESEQRAIAAREAKDAPKNALQIMAGKLAISPGALQKTLINTVFAACKTDEQFFALVVVANQYGLNPLLKEIYAFPASGGGIVPMVGVDGWIRIMNEHPDFDGIEFEYHNDTEGKTYAIEAVIYHKGRTHPVKVIEYMDECEGTTGPWKKSPRRMLRHRALIQCARIAFGFSGIYAEGEDPTGEVIDITPQPTNLPSSKSIAEELGDEIQNFDKETGEVVETATGMTEVDEETARALDAGEVEEGEFEEEQGEEEAEPEGEANPPQPAWLEVEKDLSDRLRAVTTQAELKAVESEFLAVCGGWPEQVQTDFEAGIVIKRKEFQ